MKVARSGGTPLTLCEAENPHGASWMEGRHHSFWARGQEAYGRSPLTVASRASWSREGKAGPTAPRSSLMESRSCLPLQSQSSTGTSANIVVASLDTGERKTLIRVGGDARYLPTGHLVYAVESTLFAVPFDAEKLELMADPAPVLEGVLRSVGGSNGVGASQFSFSQDGSLAFVSEGSRRCGAEPYLGRARWPVERDHRKKGYIFASAPIARRQTPRHYGPEGRNQRCVDPRH